MAPSESARHELYNALIPLLGSEPTETLMSQLLPTPAVELATKVELQALHSEMNDRFDRMSERFDRMLLAQIGGFTALVVAVFLN